MRTPRVVQTRVQGHAQEGAGGDSLGVCVLN